MTFFVEALNKNLDSQTPAQRIGEYLTKAEAIIAAHRFIEEFLNQEYEPGMDSDALFARYYERGEFPFIFRDDDNTFNVPGFSHIRYAITCATEICGDKK